MPASPADSRDEISTLWKLLAPMGVQYRSIACDKPVCGCNSTTDTSQQCKCMDTHLNTKEDVWTIHEWWWLCLCNIPITWSTTAIFVVK